MRGDKYSREETMLVFELYCTIPSSKVTVRNPQIIALARAFNRPVNSVKLKMQNFKAYDPAYTQDGRIGMAHGSKLDESICREFFYNWDLLVAEVSGIKQRLGLSLFGEDESEILSTPMGYNKTATATQRIGQSFFRRALLSAYSNECCFTGIAVPELLRHLI